MASPGGGTVIGTYYFSYYHLAYYLHINKNNQSSPDFGGFYCLLHSVRGGLILQLIHTEQSHVIEWQTI